MKTIIITLLLLSYYAGQGQESLDNAYERFEKLLLHKIEYPERLKDRCIPTVALLLIDFNQSGEVDTIKVTDSAFDEISKQLSNIKSIEIFDALFTYATQAGATTCRLAIPLHIDTEEMGSCASILMSNDFTRLTSLDGNSLTGSYFICPIVYMRRLTGFTYQSSN
ncbi:hypothetical protein [Sphingobacterium suaedae]|uniref:Uncharacterized protein n=1 Tax=Sphingobacterium suaedae TaxID=1686402 RepID=A0ABW5KNC4_9SPHI